MKVFRAIWLIFLVCFIGVLTIIAVFFKCNGIHKPVPREIVAKNNIINLGDTQDTVEAKTVYSAFTEPVIDSDGYLCIPNNTSVSDVKTEKIATEFCSFNIPKSWVNRVVIKSVKMDQTTDTELYDKAVSNTGVIQFFEKNTYEKYQTQEYAFTEDAARKGKLTELYVSDTERNDLEDKYSNPLEIHVADISDNHIPAYSVFLYEMKESDNVCDKEFAKEYRFLYDTDYKSCIIGSLRSEKGSVDFANSYIKSRYTKTDESGEMPENYKYHSRISQEKPKHDFPIPKQDTNGMRPVYNWQSFASPWSYTDRGTGYPYSAVESGGVPVEIPQDDTQVDLDLSGDSAIDMNNTESEEIPAQETEEEDVLVLEADTETDTEQNEPTEEYEESEPVEETAEPVEETSEPEVYDSTAEEIVLTEE